MCHTGPLLPILPILFNSVFHSVYMSSYPIRYLAEEWISTGEGQNISWILKKVLRFKTPHSFILQLKNKGLI